MKERLTPEVKTLKTVMEPTVQVEYALRYFYNTFGSDAFMQALMVVLKEAEYAADYTSASDFEFKWQPLPVPATDHFIVVRFTEDYLPGDVDRCELVKAGEPFIVWTSWARNNEKIIKDWCALPAAIKQRPVRRAR